MERTLKQKRLRSSAAQEITEALSELGENFFDEALCYCDTEKDAAFLASATLVRALERESILFKPNRPHVAPPRAARPQNVA